MISFLKLIRYKNLLMVLLTMVLTKYALIESFISPSYLTHFQFILLVISVLCITAGGYIVNDIFDVEADKINKPNKVFIDVTFAKKNAWRSYFILSFLGLSLSYQLSLITENINCFYIFLVTVFGLFLYSILFKKVLLIGNLIISILVSLTIYIVYLLDFKYIPNYYLNFNQQTDSTFHFRVWITIILYMIFAFISTLIREIIKDLEDINGDLKINAKTLPILIGRKRSIYIINLIVFLSLIFGVIILKSLLIHNKLLFFYFLFITFIPFIFLAYKLNNVKTKKHYSYLSDLMKLIMCFGILSMLLFKFI
ncbi:hypothetical protein LPB136_04100 [Tenacibaculum todarodis]|uniref:Prenyltransferase n=1 Tax=Tenacibaculum todarodis TaxID=1850252 RepID=A0A1L3JHK7_9FLAO|nr:geranylgeranylglycerol-phosphate geranylgeranyltransferase [Tenacibaculum todarodis]APG64599.1 hypothetical protein LPB136_04100 [Tenacibaculum todarodis]